MLQLAGGVILGVALWLRHDPKTGNLLELDFDGTPAPSTFYISMYLICTISTVCLYVQSSHCLMEILSLKPVDTVQ